MSRVDWVAQAFEKAASTTTTQDRFKIPALLIPLLREFLLQ
jgi:hypothetical protein